MKQKAISSVYQLANTIGALPTAVHMYLDEHAKEIGFADVYHVLPPYLQYAIAGPWELEQALWDSHFSFSWPYDGGIREFFSLLGYPSADIVSSWYISNGIQTLLVSPWGREAVSASKMYMTLQEIEDYYSPVMGPDNTDSWYINSILGVYKEMSVPLHADDIESEGCVLAYERSLGLIRGILNAVAAHPPLDISPVTIQFVFTVTKSILQNLEKVALPQ